MARPRHHPPLQGNDCSAPVTNQRPFRINDKGLSGVPGGQARRLAQELLQLAEGFARPRTNKSPGEATCLWLPERLGLSGSQGIESSVAGARMPAIDSAFCSKSTFVSPIFGVAGKV